MRIALMAGIGLIVLGFCGAAAGEPDPKDREIAALKKENELLKKEVELLKKEMEQLKGPAGDKAKPAKTTRDDVEYEFVSIKSDGNVAYMNLAVTAKKAGKVLDTNGIRLFAADGAEHKAPLIGVLKEGGLQTGRLPEDVRTVVSFKIGRVPAEITEFTTIQLPGVFGGRGKARLDNPVVLKGVFKVER